MRKFAYLYLTTSAVYGQFIQSLNITALWDTLPDRIFWNVLSDAGVVNSISATDVEFSFIDDFIAPNSNCWCYPIKRFAPRHNVQDDYDSDCQNFHRCMGCCSMNDNSCNTLSQELQLESSDIGALNVTAPNGDVKQLFNSAIVIPPGSSLCYENLATCWADFESSVTQMVRDNADFSALTYSNDYTKSCPKKNPSSGGNGGSGSSHKRSQPDQCCGTAPTWYPFTTDSGANVCCGSTVINTAENDQEACCNDSIYNVNFRGCCAAGSFTLSNQECCNDQIITIPTCLSNEALNTTVNANGCNDYVCEVVCCDVNCLVNPVCTEPNHQIVDRVFNGCPVRECILVCPEIVFPTCSPGEEAVSTTVDNCETYACQPIVCAPLDPTPPSEPDCPVESATPIVDQDQQNGCDIWKCMCFDPLCAATQGENQTDYVIILDESGSVGATNFEVMKEFVRYFIDALPLEGNGARMAVITYDSAIADMFSFDQSVNLSKTQLKDIVTAYSFGGGTTHTYLGFEHYINVLSIDPLNRPTVKDIVVVLTDGQSSNRQRVFDSAKFIREDMQTELYAIGIANADITELVNVASSPHSKYLREINEFGDLEDVANEFVLDFCPQVECTSSSRLGLPWIENEVHNQCNDPLIC